MLDSYHELTHRIHNHTCFLLVIKAWQGTCNMSWQGLVTAHTTILKQSHKDLFKPSRTHCVAQCNRICHEHVMALKSPGVSSLVDRHDRFWSSTSKVVGDNWKNKIYSRMEWWRKIYFQQQVQRIQFTWENDLKGTLKNHMFRCTVNQTCQCFVWKN